MEHESVSTYFAYYWSGVFFNDDLTEIQACEQRDLRALAAYARNQGKEAQVVSSSLGVK